MATARSLVVLTAMLVGGQAMDRSALTVSEREALGLAERFGEEAAAKVEAEVADAVGSLPPAGAGSTPKLRGSLLGTAVKVNTQRHVYGRAGSIAAKDGDVIQSNSSGKSGMVLGHVLIQNQRATFSSNFKSAPMWLRTLLAVNQRHCEKHGHTMVLRTKASAGTPSWQRPYCTGRNSSVSVAECIERFEREDNNWEKEAMMLDYLERPGVNYALIMDADIALTQPSADTMRNMAKELERTGRDILLTDEDWRKGGKGHINGGVLFAKATDYSRTFFRELMQAHTLGPTYRGPAPRCVSNEQLCLHGSLMPKQNHGYPGLGDKLLLSSGTRYNRGSSTFLGCEVINQPCKKKSVTTTKDLELLHFMGGSKWHVSKLMNSTVLKSMDSKIIDYINM